MTLSRTNPLVSEPEWRLLFCQSYKLLKVSGIWGHRFINHRHPHSRISLCPPVWPVCCGLHAHRTAWLLSSEHIQQYTIYSSLQRLEWDEHHVSFFTDLDSSKATADHYILIVIFKIESWWQRIGSQASGRDNNAIVKVLKRGQEFTERAEPQSHVWGFRCIVCHHKSHNKHERGTCFSLLNSEVYHDYNQI